MTKQSSVAMIWPTALAGLLGSLVLASAVLAVPTDAATPSTTIVAQAR